MHVLAVDLGTSNTVAVLAAHGRQPRVVEIDGSATMPSAVFLGEDGVLVVGREAQRRARLAPARFEPNPKRRVDEQTLLLGDRVVPVVDALAAVLRRVAEETTRQLGGQRVDEVRLTHPAQWGALRCNVLLAAARQAGLDVNPLLVPEPVAAAAHFASFPGKALAPGQALAVYDLGAGTFDCAVVGATQNGYAVLAENGLPDLGGLDVDQALAEYVGTQAAHRDSETWQRLQRPQTTADRRAQRALREDVRAAKEALSRHPQTEVPMPEPFDDVLVTRAELEGLIRPDLTRSVDVIGATIQASGFAPNGLRGIYLVGGSSRIPLVATLLGERLRVVPTSLDQPETAVALGAHHVSREALAARTQDLARPVPMQQTGGWPGATSTAMPPNAVPPNAVPPNAVPPNAARANVAPLPNNYPTQQGFPPAAAARGTSGAGRDRKMTVGSILVIALVLLAVGGVALLRGDSGTVTAQDCQDFTATTDAEGFTPCLRQLAGTVADTAKCSQATANTDPDIRKAAGISVTCSIGSGSDAKSITYFQGPSARNVGSAVDTTGGGRGAKVEADWHGNGLTGKVAARTSDSTGVLAFTVDDRPIAGELTQIGVSAGKADPQQLIDTFTTDLLPGR